MPPQIRSPQIRSPKISVIIPVYNGSVYLPEAIESVLCQTYGNYEILVIDDGSTDDTALVLQPYLNQNPDKIRYWYQANQGVGAARNFGLQQAQGDWITFLDQDDRWLPDKLTLQVKCLQSQPGLGIIHSGWQIIEHQGKVRAAIQPWRGLPALNLQDWLCWKPVFLGAMLFDKAWLVRVGGFNPIWQQTGDVELVLRLAALGCPAAWVQQATVQYRQHSDNASRDVVAQTTELMAVLDHFFQREHSSKIRALESQSRYQSWVWSAWRAYQAGYVEQSGGYLRQALRYSSQPLTATLCDWSAQFQQYSADYGVLMDSLALSQWMAKSVAKLISLNRAQMVRLTSSPLSTL